MDGNGNTYYESLASNKWMSEEVSKFKVFEITGFSLQ